MVRVEAYIPTYPTTPHGKFSAQVQSRFGCTVVNCAHGAWRGADGILSQEDVSVFIVLMPHIQLHEFEALLTQYKEDANQEAVLYTFSEVNAVLF